MSSFIEELEKKAREMDELETNCPSAFLDKYQKREVRKLKFIRNNPFIDDQAKKSSKKRCALEEKIADNELKIEARLLETKSHDTLVRKRAIRTVNAYEKDLYARRSCRSSSKRQLDTSSGYSFRSSSSSEEEDNDIHEEEEDDEDEDSLTSCRNSSQSNLDTFGYEFSSSDGDEDEDEDEEDEEEEDEVEEDEVEEDEVEEDEDDTSVGSEECNVKKIKRRHIVLEDSDDDDDFHGEQRDIVQDERADHSSPVVALHPNPIFMTLPRYNLNHQFDYPSYAPVHGSQEVLPFSVYPHPQYPHPHNYPHANQSVETVDPQDLNSIKWCVNFECLRKAFRENDYSLRRDSIGFKLHDWLTEQRRQRNNGILAQWRLHRLDSSFGVGGW